MQPTSLEDILFFGPYGALNPSGDMILETRAWRERLFAQRAPESQSPYPGWVQRLSGIVNQGMPGGMIGGGGQLALNQLLIVMDGIDNPPFMRRVLTNKINQFLDALYVIPIRIGKVSLRLPRAKPRSDQIYFIGATNVPIDQLDPALTRPGRMGRHVWFRTPTKQDRLDIFELYIQKVAHDPELDRPERRDEIARITSGYPSPTPRRKVGRNGEVEVGDLVVGAGGKSTPVLAVHPRGEMDGPQGHIQRRDLQRVHADHLWTVEALDPRMLPRTFTVTELLERRQMVTTREPVLSTQARTSRVLVFGRTADRSLPPRTPFLGDGGFRHVTPDFCTADEDNLAAVEALLPAEFHRYSAWADELATLCSRKGVPRSQANPLTRSLRSWCSRV